MAETPVRLRRRKELTGVDREHEAFKKSTSDMAFPNRAMIKLSDDYFMQHTRHHLGDAMPYRRIPISSENRVWYFFKHPDHIEILMRAIRSTPESIKRKSEPTEPLRDTVDEELPKASLH